MEQILLAYGLPTKIYYHYNDTLQKKKQQVETSAFFDIVVEALQGDTLAP